MRTPKRFTWSYFLQDIDEKGKLWQFLIIDNDATENKITRYINRSKSGDVIPFFIMQNKISLLCKQLNAKRGKEADNV